VNVSGWLLVAALLVLLELCVRRFDLHDSIAAPSETLRALGEGLSSGELSGELRTTLGRYVEGLAIAIVLGVALGVLIGSSRMLVDASSVLLELLRPIPAVVLIPAAMVALGLGTPMIRFVVAWAAVWPILITTLYGVRGTDRMLHDVSATSGVAGLRKLVRVTLPAALPSIATGIRVSAPIALLVCVTAEFLTVAGGGLGTYMQQKQTALELPELYAAATLTALLGYAINVVLRATERRAVFWVGEERVR
jgi:ABC-type nitrate/sulfonate/bicarbonate transport system permease component